MTQHEIDYKKIHNFCMAKPCAYESRPFGSQPICYRIAGKIFAQLSTDENWYKITLKTNPAAADFYRSAFPFVVVRGYHCPAVQQPYWNTVTINEIDHKILYQMIDDAYEETVKKLPQKVQNRIPVLAEYSFIKTNGENDDFVKLCDLLDQNLDMLVGNKFNREQYGQYNQRESIHDVIIVYKNKEPVACGAYKFYDDITVELKRIYVDSSQRGKNVGKELIRRLEADARIAGFRYAVLETSEPLSSSIQLYKKMGYKIIKNYGQYINMQNSICMSKKL